MQRLKPRIGKKGYVRYVLYSDKKPGNVNIQRLIWETFKGPIPEGMQVNHIDGDKQNNNIENLEIVTASQNIRHAIDNNLCNFKSSANHAQAKKVGQYSLSDELIKVWNCMTDIERELGFFQANVSACCSGRNKTYKGFKWQLL